MKVEKMKAGFYLVSYIAVSNGSNAIWGDSTFTVAKDEDPIVALADFRQQIEKSLKIPVDNKPTIVNVVRLS